MLKIEIEHLQSSIETVQVSYRIESFKISIKSKWDHRKLSLQKLLLLI